MPLGPTSQLHQCRRTRIVKAMSKSTFRRARSRQVASLTLGGIAIVFDKKNTVERIAFACSMFQNFAQIFLYLFLTFRVKLCVGQPGGGDRQLCPGHEKACAIETLLTWLVSTFRPVSFLCDTHSQRIRPRDQHWCALYARTV